MGRRAPFEESEPVRTEQHKRVRVALQNRVASVVDAHKSCMQTLLSALAEEFPDRLGERVQASWELEKLASSGPKGLDPSLQLVTLKSAWAAMATGVTQPEMELQGKRSARE